MDRKIKDALKIAGAVFIANGLGGLLSSYGMGGDVFSLVMGFVLVMFVK